MIQPKKQHYAVLRESVTPGSAEAQTLLAGLRARAAHMGVSDSERSAVSRLCGLAMREAKVMTVNDLVHLLGLIFFAALLLLLLPLVKRVATVSR